MIYSMTNKAKILLIDIETSYIIAKVWGLFKQNISPSQIVQDWYIIMGSWQWLGEDKIHNISCTKKELLACNDKRVIEKLSEQILKADIVIGHNVNRFDLKRIKARVMVHKLPSLSHAKTLDTLCVARKEAAFTSNKLDAIGKTLGVGQKIVNEPGLWDKVMAGDMKAVKRMATYCDQDVNVLKELYLYMLPYISNHPKLSMFTGNQEHDPCPNCDSNNSIKYGFAYKISNKYQKFRCKACGNAFVGSKRLI